MATILASVARATFAELAKEVGLDLLNSLAEKIFGISA
jgi:hypothetical protein